MSILTKEQVEKISLKALSATTAQVQSVCESHLQLLIAKDELIEALQECLGEVDRYAPTGKVLSGPYADAVRSNARAALSKARGE